MSKTNQASASVISGDVRDVDDVRLQISELDLAIVELREKADSLLQSAAARDSPAFLGSVESVPVRPQHAVSEPAPVWPRLATYEPQHGAGGLPADDGAFGAQAPASGTGADATVLEFAPREAVGESEPASEPTHAETAPTPSQGMPADWNTAGEDDAAIEKFFSAEVEPEPAQRWLLND